MRLHAWLYKWESICQILHIMVRNTIGHVKQILCKCALGEINYYYHYIFNHVFECNWMSTMLHHCHELGLHFHLITSSNSLLYAKSSDRICFHSNSFQNDHILEAHPREIWAFKVYKRIQSAIFLRNCTRNQQNFNDISV